MKVRKFLSDISSVFPQGNVEQECLSFVLKDIPGCFFTRTSLLKSSNNLELICKM